MIAFFVFIAVIVLCAIGLYIKNRPTETFSPRMMTGDRATPVQTAAAQHQSFDRYLEALGTVTAAQTVVVMSRVDGELTALHFEEGQHVQAGALLAEIDPRPYRVQLTQAEGQMARDKAQLENAKNDLARYKILLTQDSVSQQQVDNQAALVAQYTGSVQYDQAQIDNAKLNLAYTKITAPISGRIGLRRVDVGNMVRASDANGIAVINEDQPIDVLFTINESEVHRVADAVYGGARFPVEAWDRGRQIKLAEGIMTTLDNQIDSATGTIKVKARFPNKDQRLFPNQFVNVRMKVATLDQALLIPSQAVQRGSVGTFVYVLSPGKDDPSKTVVTVRLVSLGDEADGQRVILSGIAAGERVVIDGTDRLREGIAVEDMSVARNVAKGTEANAAATDPASPQPIDRALSAPPRQKPSSSP
ncbi:MAG: MdtA/MuxA family multidrug efflux RND transporter periplasmic adaptor subunit [Burkholderiales bacterium]|nr:MdtA/MuxA family multidrug efflux RND transporter periplasmic adaptor subunit [Burkholderiales bacterium]